MVEMFERKISVCVKMSASSEPRHRECLESVRADEITNTLTKAWRRAGSMATDICPVDFDHLKSTLIATPDTAAGGAILGSHLPFTVVKDSRST